MCVLKSRNGLHWRYVQRFTKDLLRCWAASYDVIWDGLAAKNHVQMLFSPKKI